MTDINDTPDAETTAPSRKGGWPKGKPRGNREPLRAAPQSPLREQEYDENGRAVVYTASGERLTRKRSASTDPFYIDPSEIPEGMSYQWNRVSVVGEPDIDHQVAMRENGWRPVPASRHASKFMPEGYSPNAPIERGGLRLEERPMILTEEARREESDYARMAMQGAQEGLGLSMPSGFSRDNPNLARMERSGTSRSFAPAPDAPRPRLPIDQG